MNKLATGLLTASMAVSTPAFGEESTHPTQDLSGIETVLPEATPNNGAIRGALTLAAAKVTGLGFEVQLGKDTETPDSIRFIGVPNDQFKTVIDTVNTTRLGAIKCVGFVVVPDTDLSPSEYDGPWEMGAKCNAGMY